MLAVLIVLLVVGLSIGTSSVVPPHAIVRADPEHSIYFAPSCLPAEHVDVEELDHALEAGDTSRAIFAIGYLPITIQEARDDGLEPERDCMNSGAFTQEGRSVTGLVIERIGVLPPKPDRWNDDGTWNW